MNKKTIFVISIFIFSLMVSTGCFDLFSDDGSITYEAHPTKVGYTLTYGYWVNCTDNGKYDINYDCDIPEALNGQVSSIIVHNSNYKDVTIASFNTMKRWNISDNIDFDYKLGLTANVISESFMVSDLNGANALTIQEISDNYPHLVSQYCQAQSNETTVIINPDNTAIQTVAIETYNDADTDNAFLVAKELFKWLKEHTSYQTHTGENNVQKSTVTMQCKTGDCDDLSFLYISLCRSVNIPARFIRGFLVEKNNGIIEVTPHAWAEVFVGGNIGQNGWIPVECAGTANKVITEIHQNFGLETANHIRLFKDDGSNESLIASLTSLSYIRYNHNRNIETEYFTDVYNFVNLQSKELFVDKNDIRKYQ